MSNLKLRKYKCGGCYTIIGPTNEFINKCLDCGSTLLEKQEILAEDWIQWIFEELENANYHNQVDLPEKLFDRILPILPEDGSGETKIELARIISEEFYNNM